MKTQTTSEKAGASQLIAQKDSGFLNNTLDIAIPSGQAKPKEKRYNVTDIAKDVRFDLKRVFPKCKFSVTIEKYSMGQSMTVALMEAPFEVFASDFDSNGNKQDKDYAQLNHYQFRSGDWHEKRVSNCTLLTEEAWSVLQQAATIANGENWDNSDPQTDYFDVNYHFSLHVGKWNKPFVNTSRQLVEA